MKNIVVNAYPLRSGGALQILWQFFDAVKKHSPKNHKYYIFISDKVEIRKNDTPENVILVSGDYSTTLKKIKFTLGGVKKYLKKHNITPSAVISLTSTIIELFKASDALVFPSYIETFGLPMIEAAMLGTKVLASDMDFSREVLRNYTGAEFVQTYNAKAWAEAICSLKKEEKFTPLEIVETDSWGILFDKINKI